jgi:putative flippase GtrA
MAHRRVADIKLKDRCCVIRFFDRLLPFLMVGGVATAVHWSVMYLLVQQLVIAALATAIGSVLGFIFAYIGHSRITFQHAKQAHVILPVFALASCLGWSINLGLFIFFLAINFPILLAQFLATAGATLCNYFTSKQFVFNEGYRHES